jgi:hypothetical protein
MGKITISESKKEKLLDLLNEVENELCDFIHNAENDESIPKDSWDQIDHQSANIFSKINSLRDEIIFS